MLKQMIMRPYEALDQTFRMHRIVAADVARKADVTPGELSNYRNGRRDWGTDKLHKVLLCLSPKEFQYFCDLIYEDAKQSV